MNRYFFYFSRDIIYCGHTNEKKYKWICCNLPSMYEVNLLGG